MLRCLTFFMMAGLGIHAQNDQPPPNFVILMADDLGYGDVGVFGNNTIKTPNLDKLGMEGAKLTQMLAASTVCTPSRAAFLTGRYPIRSGMYHDTEIVLTLVAQSGGLPANETTFAKVLRERGYSTALIGKWHLGMSCERWNDFCHHPHRYGFDYFYGLPFTNVRSFSDPSPNVTAEDPCLYFARSLHSFKFANSVLLQNQEVVEMPIRLRGLAQRFVQESSHFIEREAQRKKPFLLFLSFTHVHTALMTAPEFEGRSLHGRYGDNVEELDWAVGRIVALLDRLNLSNNTLVFFTSDNGGHLEEVGPDGQHEGGYNGKFKGGKSMAGTEGGFRVPTLARFPNRIPAGSTVDAPLSLMDLFPTLLTYARVPLPENPILDGKDMVPLLEGKNVSSPHQFLFHYCGNDIHAVRYKQNDTHVWKLHLKDYNRAPGQKKCSTWICFCNDTHYLDTPVIYNIQQDPYEEHPINATSTVHKEVLQIISNAMKEHQSNVKHVQSQFGPPHNKWKAWLQPCCNFPFCECKDEKYSNW